MVELPDMDGEPLDLSRLRTIPLADRVSTVGVDQFAWPPHFEGSSDVAEHAAEAARRIRSPDAGQALVEAPARGSARHRGHRRARHQVWAGARAAGSDGSGGHHRHRDKWRDDRPRCGDRARRQDLRRRDARVSAKAHSAWRKRPTASATRRSAKVLRPGRGWARPLEQALLAADAPHAAVSLFAGAARRGVPVTVHVAIGTDVLHMHPTADGAAIGEGSLRDFRALTTQMAALGGGGVLLNVGSAVILPEVILKAFGILRNLGHDLTGLSERRPGFRPPLPGLAPGRRARERARRTRPGADRPPRDHAAADRRPGGGSAGESQVQVFGVQRKDPGMPSERNTEHLNTPSQLWTATCDDGDGPLPRGGPPHRVHERLLRSAARRACALLAGGPVARRSARRRGRTPTSPCGRLKGDGRPLVSEAERAELLAALECVDHVTLFGEETPEALIAPGASEPAREGRGLSGGRSAGNPAGPRTWAGRSRYSRSPRDARPAPWCSNWAVCPRTGTGC